MLKITQCETDKDKAHIKDLLLEYFSWINSMWNQEFNLSFDVNSSLEECLAQLDEFMPPAGRLLLARYKGKIVGCVGLRRIEQEIGEIKRLYVQPKFRAQGIGRELLENIIYEAANLGYSKLRLDTAPFTKAAQALYHSLGFQDIAPYFEKTEVPPEYRDNWIFLELRLY
ncbi:GNAT family N-acetyltransferase [Nostoc sp. FACHB-87]|uniref:GNAT family N-acetyltransferase n=1 Tax=Nostocaceae TaxID=1162 RepID=UPI0016878463|nr:MULTISPECIES: GNAT family N-acetyltransferase [Nostocaceae]MBD2455623.1 GNAT family N-acetyltransferase [Nostoc sp. FACHB-87]MBD2477254.1 GNAT family N-acetyltransferase [Anabaena sp. FACHB-83]